MTTLASVSTPSAAPTYGNAQIQRSQLVRRHHDADGDDDAPKAERREGPGRRNPLVAAMMSALSNLVPASNSSPATTPATDAPATPTATAPATTPSATTTATTPSSDPATSLREAAYAFAHALYSALRGGGGGDGGERHGHHHHHGHRSGGYGDLAERLSALATRLEAASGTPTPPSDAASPTPPAADPAPVVETPVSEPAPATAGAGNINITINLNINIGTAATPAAPSSSNPLVDAFKKLLTALGADSASSASPTERLTAFLRQMAESLSGDKSTTPAAPTSGSLLNVSA